MIRKYYLSTSLVKNCRYSIRLASKYCRHSSPCASFAADRRQWQVATMLSAMKPSRKCTAITWNIKIFIHHINNLERVMFWRRRRYSHFSDGVKICSFWTSERPYGKPKPKVNNIIFSVSAHSSRQSENVNHGKMEIFLRNQLACCVKCGRRTVG